LERELPQKFILRTPTNRDLYDEKMELPCCDNRFHTAAIELAENYPTSEISAPRIA
jgi:hypothetical protein